MNDLDWIQDWQADPLLPYIGKEFYVPTNGSKFLLKGYTGDSVRGNNPIIKIILLKHKYFNPGRVFYFNKEKCLEMIKSKQWVFKDVVTEENDLEWIHDVPLTLPADYKPKDGEKLICLPGFTRQPDYGYRREQDDPNCGGYGYRPNRIVEVDHITTTRNSKDEEITIVWPIDNELGGIYVRSMTYYVEPINEDIDIDWIQNEFNKVTTTDLLHIPEKYKGKTFKIKNIAQGYCEYNIFPTNEPNGTIRTAEFIDTSAKTSGVSDVNCEFKKGGILLFSFPDQNFGHDGTIKGEEEFNKKVKEKCEQHKCWWIHPSAIEIVGEVQPINEDIDIDWIQDAFDSTISFPITEEMLPKLISHKFTFYNGGEIETINGKIISWEITDVDEYEVHYKDVRGRNFVAENHYFIRMVNIKFGIGKKSWPLLDSNGKPYPYYYTN